jgi:hypothetical protein
MLNGVAVELDRRPTGAEQSYIAALRRQHSWLRQQAAAGARTEAELAPQIAELARRVAEYPEWRPGAPTHDRTPRRGSAVSADADCAPRPIVRLIHQQPPMTTSDAQR